MGISETIIAAIIGAGATMVTAIFQLLRNRAPSEVRPKKNRIRSLLATVALMAGCIVGGYAWSSLRAVSATEQMRSTLQSEFTRQFAALAAPQPIPASAVQSAGLTSTGDTGSLLHLPPCRLAVSPEQEGNAACSELTAHVVALCAPPPVSMPNGRVQVMVRTLEPESAWQTGDAGSSEIGDLHVSEVPSEQFPGADGTAQACLNVANWSLTDTLVVRLLVKQTSPPQAVPEPSAAPITASLQ